MENKLSKNRTPLGNEGLVADIAKFYALLNEDLDCLNCAPKSQWAAAANRLKILATAMWIILRDSGLGPVEMGCLRKINSLNSVLISSGFPPLSIAETADQEHQKVQQIVRQISI